MSESFDVFLSYNSEDKAQVSELNELLKEEGIRTWFDGDQVRPGDLFIKKLEEGLSQSNVCAVFVGQKGIGPWETKEIYAALQRQVEKADFKVIPVLLSTASKRPDLPLFMRDTRWVDLGRNPISGLRELLGAIHHNSQTLTYAPLLFQVGNTIYEDGLPTKFRAEVAKIVDLLVGESLYSRRDVFVREIIQNSVDACERRKGDVPNYVPEIAVTIDETQGYFQVEDNGEGMNSSLLIERFAVIGKSIRDEERVLKRTLADPKERLFLIAKFGIGFITAFIAGERIVVSTKYENETQINFSISGVNSPFKYTEKSECGHDPEKVGTTVRIYLSEDFRKGGKHYIDLLEATKRYTRHYPHIRVYQNGNQIVLPDDWNTTDCKYVQIYRIPRQVELHLGVHEAGGRLIASNGGFYITDNLEVIVPYYLPTWIVGEIYFWPGSIDLTLARDANERTAEIRTQLRVFFQKFLIGYIEENQKAKIADDRVRDLLLYYYYVYSNNSSWMEDPLLTNEQTREILLDVIHLPFGTNQRDQSLRAIIDQLLRSEKKVAYTYWFSNAYTALGVIIRRLQAQGDVVFEYHARKVNLYGMKGGTAEVSEYNVLLPLLKTFGIELKKIDDLPPDQIRGLEYNIASLPKPIQEELERAKGKVKLGFVKIPGGDLTFKVKDTLFLNPEHEAFGTLISKLQKLPRSSLRAYILGLTQQSIQTLLE